MFSFPTTLNEWREIAQEFKEIWNFHQTCGALDGTCVHCVIPQDNREIFRPIMRLLQRIHHFVVITRLCPQIVPLLSVAARLCL